MSDRDPDQFNVVGTEGPPSSVIGDAVMFQGIGYPQRAVTRSAIFAFTALATDDAGNGTVHDDVNNTDFIGQPPGNTDTFLTLGDSTVLDVAHKDVLYQYTGPKQVTIGLGGNYTTTASNWIPQGTVDHTLLTNVDAADSHPTSAITGLDAKQAAQDAALATHEGLSAAGDNAHGTRDYTDQTVATHAGLTASANDVHGTKTYTDSSVAAHATLTASGSDVHGSKTYTDGAIATHLGEPNPHDQYLLESTALVLFSHAAYLGAYAAPAVGVSIGSGWTTVPWTDLSILIPRGGSVDLTNNTFTIALDGIWQFSVSGTFGHDDSNQGRFFFARLFNVTTGIPSSREFRLFTGRNSDGTPFAWQFLAEVTEAQVNHDWRIEIGNASGTYVSADWQGELSLFNVGEWRDPLPSA